MGVRRGSDFESSLWSVAEIDWGGEFAIKEIRST